MYIYIMYRSIWETDLQPRNASSALQPTYYITYPGGLEPHMSWDVGMLSSIWDTDPLVVVINFKQGTLNTNRNPRILT